MGAEQGAAGPSGAGDWLGVRERQREERAKHLHKQLSTAGSGRAWRAEHFSQPGPPITGQQKIILFISLPGPCFSEGGRQNKGIKHLALLLMQGARKGISKLLSLQTPKSFSLLLTQQNWSYVVGSLFWVLMCSDGLFRLSFHHDTEFLWCTKLLPPRYDLHLWRSTIDGPIPWYKLA